MDRKDGTSTLDEYDLWELNDKKDRGEEDKPERSMQASGHYHSIKSDWLENKKSTNGVVSEVDFWESEGIRYFVDGHDVALDHSAKEKEVAEWLATTLGKIVELVPRVNIPENISTPDYLIDGQKFDLKELEGSGKNIIDNNSKKAKTQAENIIFDVTGSKLSTGEIITQLNHIYKIGRRGLNISIIKVGEELIDIFEPSKK